MTPADFHDVEPERRAAVAGDVITASHRQWQRNNRRTPALTVREAMAALQFEALLVWTAAANVRSGVVLCDEDFQRLTLACRWIEDICAEFME